MVHAVHGGGAVGSHTSQNQRRTGPQVGGHNLGAGQMIHTSNAGPSAINPDVRTKTLQLRHMGKPVSVNRFGHGTGATRHRAGGHDLGLHVGGETRIRPRHHFDRLRFAVGPDGQAEFFFGDVAAHFLQHDGHRLQVARIHPRQAHFAPGHGHARHDRARFDAVGDHAVGNRFQFLDAFDDEARGAQAFDVRARAYQSLDQLGHFRFDGAIFQLRAALGQHRGHQHIASAAHRRRFEAETPAFQAPIRARVDVALFQIDIRPQGGHALKVQVHWPRAPGASARQRNPRLAEGSQQRPQHIDARAHFAHQIVRRFGAAQVCGVDDHEVVGKFGARAEAFEDGGEKAHILQVGHVVDDRAAAGQQRGGHEGQNRVFGAADGNFPVQGSRSFDDKTIHVLSLLREKSRCCRWELSHRLFQPSQYTQLCPDVAALFGLKSNAWPNV